MTVTLLIQTHNRLAKLKRLLENPVFQAELGGVNLFINAQGCADDTDEYLRDFVRRHPYLVWRLWISSQDAGVIGGRVRMTDYLLGAGLSAEDVLVYLDDDVEVLERGWLTRLVSPLIMSPKFGVTGAFGVIIRPDWSDFILALPPQPSVVDVVSISHTAVSGRIFTAGFEFDLGMHQWFHEDTDLCLWAQMHLGLGTYYVGTPESIGLHHEPHRIHRDDNFWHNWKRIRDRYAGRGVAIVERIRLDAHRSADHPSSI